MCVGCRICEVVLDCIGELQWGGVELQFDSGEEFLREAIQYRHAEIGRVPTVVDIEWISSCGGEAQRFRMSSTLMITKMSCIFRYQMWQLLPFGSEVTFALVARGWACLSHVIGVFSGRSTAGGDSSHCKVFCGAGAGVWWEGMFCSQHCVVEAWLSWVFGAGERRRGSVLKVCGVGLVAGACGWVVGFVGAVSLGTS